jgi:hypothetical protein
MPYLQYIWIIFAVLTLVCVIWLVLRPVKNNKTNRRYLVYIKGRLILVTDDEETAKRVTHWGEGNMLTITKDIEKYVLGWKIEHDESDGKERDE